MTLVTEKEAAEKWCPLARWKFASTSDQPASNRETSPTPEEGMNLWAFKGTRCIGSRCMAWRWGQDEWEPSEQIWSPGGGSYTTETPPGPREGYCGAFGKVEP